MGAWKNLLANSLTIDSPTALPEMCCQEVPISAVRVDIERVQGGPTSALIACRFEVLSPTTHGATTEMSPGGVWLPISADDHAGNLPDGGWPAVLATEINTSRTVTDLACTVGTRALQSSTIAFSASDVGLPFYSPSLSPGGYANYIDSVTDAANAVAKYKMMSSASAGTLTIANSASVQRRIVGVPRWRLAFHQVSLTGGSSPSFKVSVLVDSWK